MSVCTTRVRRPAWRDGVLAVFCVAAVSLIVPGLAGAVDSCSKFGGEAPRSIPELGIVVSYVAVPFDARVTDVNILGLSGTDPSLDNLAFELTSARGTPVVLVSRGTLCAGGDSFWLNLDDSATTPVPCPPTDQAQSHRPSVGLSAFNGEIPRGTWQLVASSAGSLVPGSLSWELQVCTQPVVDKRLRASRYDARLVQAFDECKTDGSQVTLVPNGLLGCGGGELDGTPFDSGRLIVRSAGARTSVLLVLKSSRTDAMETAGTPPLASKEVAAQLVLRATGSVDATQYTFADAEVICPPIEVPATGNVVQKVELSLCTLPAGAAVSAEFFKTGTNVEIVGAAVVDANTGLAIAVPGVRKKP